jgi:hypothetical protein
MVVVVNASLKKSRSRLLAKDKVDWNVLLVEQSSKMLLECLSSFKERFESGTEKIDRVGPRKEVTDKWVYVR